jgi:hypothetical protein
VEVPVTAPEELGAHLRITELAEKLGGLDTREGEHFLDLTGKLGRLAEAVQGTDERLGRHGEILSALEGLDEQVIELARRVAALSESADEDEGKEDGKQRPYRPAPSARWWALRGEDRAEAIAGLRAWTQDVYLPGYGQLSAALPPCWAEHDLCLYSLDTLSELWMVLYLQPKRSPATLAGQAEFQTRIMPLYVAQMAAEAKGCDHGRAAIR